MIDYFVEHKFPREMLYRLVAQTIRSQLDPADAAIVAGWFDRMAAGESAASVFRRKAGPKSKRDDVMLAWAIRRRIEIDRQSPTEVYKEAAKFLSTKARKVKPRTVANLYSRLLKQLGPDPDIGAQNLTPTVSVRDV